MLLAYSLLRKAGMRDTPQERKEEVYKALFSLSRSYVFCCTIPRYPSFHTLRRPQTVRGKTSRVQTK